MSKQSKGSLPAITDRRYESLVADLGRLLETARHSSARAVNASMTATYWDLGRRIIEFEQGGEKRAAYGEQVLERLAADLTARFGRGFSLRNLRSFRLFYLGWPIRQTASAESAPPSLRAPSMAFPLPWSHYVRLLSVKNSEARQFYETEALRGGWSERQLDRQIATLFYERTALSRDKVAMLKKGAKPQPEDRVDADGAVKDPLVLEFIESCANGPNKSEHPPMPKEHTFNGKELMASLQETWALAKGKLTLKTTKVPSPPSRNVPCEDFAHPPQDEGEHPCFRRISLRNR